jgi:hypothetical protein
MMAIASKGHLERARKVYDDDQDGECVMDVCSHFFTQMPQPIHRNSEIKAILSVGFTSIHSFPAEATHQHRFSEDPTITHPYEPQDKTMTNGFRNEMLQYGADRRAFLHSCAHLLGLHLFASTIAIRVILSDDISRWIRVVFSCSLDNEKCWVESRLCRRGGVKF